MTTNNNFAGLKATSKRNVEKDVNVLNSRMRKIVNNPKLTLEGAKTLVRLQKNHKRAAKAIMESLYEFYPIYRKFEVDKDGNIDTRYTIGGNTPVMKEFGLGDTKKEKLVVSVDELGYEQTVITGERQKNGRLYGKIEDVVVLAGNKDNNFMKDAISNCVYILNDSIVDANIEGAVKYKIFIWSNSNERNVEALFVNAEKYPDNAAMDLIDKVSGGSFSARIKDAVENNDGEMATKVFAKIGTRLGIMHTPAVDTNIKLNRIVYVDGDLEGTCDTNLDSEYMASKGLDPNGLYDYLKDRGVDIDRNTYDGAVYISLEAMKKMNKAMNLDLPDYMLILLALQNRSEGLMSKVFGEISRQEVLQLIRDYAYSLKDQKKVKAVYEIGDPTAPIDIVIDSNGAKLANMDRITNPNEEGFKMWILNVAKASITKTSGQMIEKFMNIDPEQTLDFLEKQSADKINEILNNKFDAELSLELDSKTNKIELSGEFMQNLLLSNPARFLRDRSALKRFIKDTTVWQESVVRKGGIQIDSLYHHVLFDITRMLTNGKLDNILGFDKELMAVEGFSLDVIAKNAEAIAEIESNSELTKEEKKKALDKIMTAVIIKYPTPGKEEYEVVRYLTKAEIEDKVNVAMLKLSAVAPEETKALGKVLKTYFFETSFGVVKLAPINILKNKLAGMDTDYDAICSIFENIFVDMAVKKNLERKNNGVAVYISYEKNTRTRVVEEETSVEEIEDMECVLVESL